ncbi:phage holin family protein [Actinacidiphila rubida]|uniref:Putative Holin-X, holin superfamily III n=1 Tax=Actinacidiphila rubida TaxID=310780 RepID=A0A1H8GQT2_9ACTN|nr:phage holin family protein [Actinacidiphila rubida]SEN46165.1 Putative Holin-X, holin superfamily III [Actinacidiphila rubida]
MAQVNGRVNGHANGHTKAGERSIGTLVKQGSEQLSTLVRQEMKLAQAELTHKGKRAGIGGGLFGGAALLAFFGLASLVAAAIAAIAMPLPLWAAALIVGGGLLLCGGLLALAGRFEVKRAVPPMPEETVGSIQDDLATIKERAKR